MSKYEAGRGVFLLSQVFCGNINGIQFAKNGLLIYRT
jgi:hypothetical protein